MSHFRGLAWSDFDHMRLGDFRALADAMDADQKAQKRANRSAGKSAPGVTRTPVMT